MQQGMEAMIKDYDERFGLNKPLWEQYIIYVRDTIRFKFNYSITNYPKTVAEMIATALPWTLGLFGTATILTFVIGSALGALLAWPKTPRIFNLLVSPFLALSAIPSYLLGLILASVFAFHLRWFPIFGGHTPGTVPEVSWAYAWNILTHAVLPAASIILSAIGFWALAMRGMMIMVQGEDFMTLGEAKGLEDRTLFLRYALRNAILPQTTSAALALGFVISGSVLVEVVFGYPGIGSLLFRAIIDGDFYLIQGVVFIVIFAIALATLALDLVLPLLDPRIVYQRD